MHPHLFEISLPTPAWLAGMSLGSCRPKWRERTEWLPTARKRRQHLGIYQKTRMCLFICLFILHLKSGYCSNWIRGKDLSPLRSLGLAAPFSRDGSHKTMSEASCPPMRKPLVLLTSAFTLSLLPPYVPHSKVMADPAVRALVDRKEGWSLGDGFQLSGLGAIALIQSNRYSMSTYC